MTELATVLSDLERTRLDACENTIEGGLETYVEVGSAIHEIRDSRLYREDYATFEDYCRGRWGWSRAYVNRQIEAASAVELLAPMGAKPSNERQAREIAPLVRESPKEAQVLWAELVEEHGDKLTATDIKQAVTERSEYKAYLEKLPPLTRAVLEQADESDDKHRNLLRNSNQLNHLANIAGKRGDEVAAEVAERALTKEGGNVFTEYENLKEEGNAETAIEVATRLQRQSDEERGIVKAEREPLELIEITRVALMEYIVKWSDGSGTTINRRELMSEFGYKKCKHCSGYGIVEGKGK